MGGCAQGLLVKEKELTRARDAMAAERRRMPWLAVEEARVRRAGGQGELARPVRRPPSTDPLPSLLRARVRGWPEHACIGCSMVADQVAHPPPISTRATPRSRSSRGRHRPASPA